MERVTLFCFAASYAVALSLELWHLYRRRPIHRLMANVFGGAGLLAHTIYLAVQRPPLGWQYGLLLALAWIYRDDYRRGGLAMLAVEDPDGQRTGWMALLYALALVPVSLVPTLVGVTGARYFVGALVLGVAYVAVSAALTRAATTARAWRVFAASIVYLPALLTLMVLDKVAT